MTITESWAGRQAPTNATEAALRPGTNVLANPTGSTSVGSGDDGIAAEGNDVNLQRPVDATGFLHCCFEFWTC